MNLNSLLEAKGAEYRKFSPKMAWILYEKLKPHIKPPKKTIQILGTNGKGSTGRFLTQIIRQNNISVLHFTSPHLFKFSERFYLNNAPIDEIKLEKAHEFLCALGLDRDASYFEYATLLCAVLAQDVDFLVLEAGLGGEFDSTSALNRDLCVYCLIDFDHEEILGHSIEEIANTKLRAMSKICLLGAQKHNEVYEIAQKIAIEKNAKLYILDSLDLKIKNYLQKHNLAAFLGNNLALALKASAILGLKCDLKSLPKLDIRARCEKIADNILIDVGHNVSAAWAIKSHLKNNKVNLIYNSYFQKNVKEILSILKANILCVEILEVPNNARILPKDKLILELNNLKIPYREFCGIDNSKNYLVFGSFSVVELFLKKYFRG